MTDFDKWDKEYRRQNMSVFNNNLQGLLWLKVRAVSRSKQINKFAEDNGLTFASRRIAEQSIELFDILKYRPDAQCRLDKFLQNINNEWYNARGIDVERLKEDLYGVRYYSWGGDRNNSLDKYLISRYVKTISNFSELQGKQVEIAGNAWNYVQNSWYNNWTSFIIESLFKRNPKVTYFPNEYMEKKVKTLLGKSTLSWLKGKCREYGITADRSQTPEQQTYTLKEKLTETGHDGVIAELNDARRQIILSSQHNPSELMKWLYENQGEMRFGAENRYSSASSAEAPSTATTAPPTNASPRNIRRTSTAATSACSNASPVWQAPPPGSSRISVRLAARYPSSRTISTARASSPTKARRRKPTTSSATGTSPSPEGATPPNNRP